MLRRLRNRAGAMDCGQDVEQRIFQLRMVARRVCETVSQPNVQHMQTRSNWRVRNRCVPKHIANKRHVEKMLQLKSAIPRTRCETHWKETCIMLNMKSRLLVMRFLLASAV